MDADPDPRARGRPAVTFSVTGITHGTLTYDSSSNTNPDGDSNGTTIVVAKP